MFAISFGGVDASSDHKSPIKIEFLSNHTAKIRFPDNSTDLIILKPTSNLKDDPTPCLFAGHVKEDEHSMVAVSGCHDSEEITITISSKKIPGGLIDLVIVDGNHEIIHNKIANNREIGLEDVDDYVKTDYLTAPPDPYAPAALGSDVEMPAKAVLETYINYDRTLLSHFNFDHTKTKQWIDRVIELARPRYSKINLPTKLELKILGEIEHRDEEIRATVPDLQYLKEKYMNKKMMSWFVKDECPPGQGCVVGIAYIGTACAGYGYSHNINELYRVSNSEVLSAHTFAHEVGHNVGMW